MAYFCENRDVYDMHEWRVYECKKNEDKKYVKTYNASVFIDETNLRYTQRGAQRFTLRSVSDGFCRFGAFECEFQL